MRKLLIVGVLVLCAFYAGLQAENLADWLTGEDYASWLTSEDSVYDGGMLTDARVVVANPTDSGEVWPGIWITNSHVVVQTDIRLAGIDTPELRPRKTWPDGTTRTEASRAREKVLAKQARDFLSTLIFESADNTFVIRQPALGKYAGRVVAEVWIVAPEPDFPGQLLNLSNVMLESGFAKPYDGTGPRPRWD